MSYKRVVKRKDKSYGPYVYESYRDSDGKVRKRYLGKVEEKKINLSVIFVSGFLILFLLMAGSYTTDVLFNEGEISGKFADSVSSFFSGVREAPTGLVVSDEPDSDDSSSDSVSDSGDSDSSSESSSESTSSDSSDSYSSDAFDSSLDSGDTEEQVADSSGVADLSDEEEVDFVINETEDDETEVEETVNETVINETEVEETVNETVVANETIVNETVINDTEIEEVANVTIINETVVANETIVNETIIVANETIVNVSDVNVSTLQYKAVINRPVKWIKKVGVVDNLMIELPADAENISVLTGDEVGEALREVDDYEDVVEESDREDIFDGNVLTGNVALDIDETEGVLVKFWGWLTGFSISGNVILEEEIASEITETENATIVDLGEVVNETGASEIAVEYYTEAPLAEEIVLANGKRVVVFGPDDVHYEDILAYTSVDNNVLINGSKKKLRLSWINESVPISVDFISYDLDGDGNIDYIEWVVPHLSNQTYELEIIVIAAEHLNENRSFVADIYDYVNETDGVSYTIPEGDFARAYFESDLMNGNVIDVVVDNNDSATILVYENGSDVVVGSVENVVGGVYYIWVNLSGSNSVFDLKSVGADIVYDYIHDGPPEPNIEFVSPTLESGQSTTNNYYEVNVSIEELNLTEVKYNWNGTNYTLYNDSTMLFMNFDNRSSLGEDADTVVDFSSQENNGTFTGGVDADSGYISSGVYDGAWMFDGDDYMEIGTDSEYQSYTQITISAWVNSTGGAVEQHIVSNFDGGGAALFTPSGTAFAFAVHDGITQIADADSTYNNAQWYHLVGVYNTTDTLLYIDGVLQSDQPATSGALTDSGAPMHVGCNPADTGGCDGQYFTGNVDNVMIWNRSLSDSEIQQLYMTNLYKYNSTQWYLYVNQTENATDGLAEGDYSYYASAKDDAGNENVTSERTITIGEAVVETETRDTNSDDLLLNVTIEANGTVDNYTHLTVSDLSPYDSLVGYWNFDGDNENSKLSTSYDWSNESNDGTMVGDAVVNSSGGRYGEGLVLDGNGDYVDCGNDASLNFTTNDFSASAWVKTDSFGVWSGIFDNKVPSAILGKLDLDYALGWEFSLHTNGRWVVTEGYLNFWMMIGGNEFFHSVDANINNGDWHQVGFTLDRDSDTGFKFFVDGAQVGSSANATSLTGSISNNLPLRIASSDFMGMGTFCELNGSIDEVMIFDTALTSTQITEIYNNQSARFKETGTQKVRAVNIEQNGSLNKVNVSTTVEENMDSRIEVRFGQMNLSVDTTGLVGYWPFEWGSAVDISGEGNDGTLVGNTIWNRTGGRNETGGFELDGTSSDYINAGTFDPSEHNITISLWYYLGEDPAAEYITLVSKSDAWSETDARWQFSRDVSGQAVIFGRKNSMVTFEYDLEAGKWVHLVLTQDDTLAHIYVNGAWKDSTSDITFAPDTTSVVKIGTGFNGTIDDVMIWNRTLSSTEITALYSNQLAKYDSTPYYTDYQNITTDVNVTFNISTEADFAFPDYRFLAGNSSSAFYSPLIEDIDLGLWSKIIADVIAPKISFASSTLGNGDTASSNYVEINVSIEEEDLGEVKYNWNGTNYTLFNDSLVLFMNFDNRSSLGENDNYVVDVSGNGNDGSASGFDGDEIVSGKYNGAVDFGGTDDYLNCGSFNPGDSGTVAFWINTDTSSDYVGGASSGDRIFGMSDGFEMRSFNSGSGYKIGNDIFAASVDVLNSSELSFGTWYFVAATWVLSNSLSEIYVDGVLIDSDTNGGDDPGTATLSLGVRTGSSPYFDGTLDEFMIFDRKLSADEISQLYMSNLYKYNSSQWYLYVNQTENSTDGLAEGDYSYFASAKDSSGNENVTEERSVTVGGSENTTSFVSTNFLLNLSTTKGRLVELGFRNESSDPWTYYNISMWGQFKNATGNYDTLDVVPTIYNFTIGNHIVVKYEIEQDNVFWNFWFDLDNDSKQVEASRFVYVPADVTLTGVGVVFDETNSYTDELNSSYVYSDVGGSYTGGYFNYDDGSDALRVAFSNLLNSSYSNTSSQQIFWYRNFSQSWNYNIDYKRFTFIPYKVGDDITEYDGYMKQYVFDHDLTNVELAGSWILRSHNKDGDIRDWFNEEDYLNGFNNARDSSASFWKDAWSTGTLIGGLMDTYNVTEDVFYLMRMIDIADYQANRTSYTFRDPYPATWGDFVDYPMGRIKYSLEAYDLTGIEYYKNVAVNSTNWFFNTQNFAADGSHSDHNITDFAYSFEGLFRAANLSGNETNINKTRDWMIFIDNDAWRETEQLFKEVRHDRFWSRGNGWWLESFLGTIDYYNNKSAIDTNRTLLESHFKSAVYSLPSYRDSSGAWHQLINDSSSYLESSGTTMIASSMAEGFGKDYLNATALGTAMDAICSVHSNEFFKVDGTINNTDRGVAPSDDPFPYTQQGYVKFARGLGIEEIVELSNRSILYTTFDEGVLVCDSGTVTDSDGHSIGVNGKVVIKNYVNGTSSAKNITLLGVDNNLTLTWGGFNVSVDYNVTNYDITSGGSVSETVASNASGFLIFNVTLLGEHVVGTEEDTTLPDLNLTINVRTIKDYYTSSETINLTDPPEFLDSSDDVVEMDEIEIANNELAEKLGVFNESGDNESEVNETTFGKIFNGTDYVDYLIEGDSIKTLNMEVRVDDGLKIYSGGKERSYVSWDVAELEDYEVSYEIAERVKDNVTLPYVLETKTYSDGSVLDQYYLLVNGLGLKQELNFTPTTEGNYTFEWTQTVPEFSKYRVFDSGDELMGFEIGRNMLGDNEEDYTEFTGEVVGEDKAIALFDLGGRRIHATSWDDVNMSNEFILTNDSLKVVFTEYVKDNLFFDPIIFEELNNMGDGYFGRTLTTGDFNNDGYDDALIGAYGYSSGTGRAYIYYGSSSMDNTADLTMTGEASSNNFGYALTTADFNNDGYDDALIGAYGYSSYTGRAYIYYGSSSMDNTADLTMTGEAAWDSFGRDLTTADFNNDGYDDALIGAYQYSTSTGRAYIYYGSSSMDNTADLTMTGESESSYFGYTLTTADFNNDGYDDALIGAYRYSSSTGRAYIYYGSSSMDNTADLTMTGEASSYFGGALTTADFNNDGYDDALIGAYGNDMVYIYTMPLWNFSYDEFSSYPKTTDLNSDVKTMENLTLQNLYGDIVFHNSSLSGTENLSANVDITNNYVYVNSSAVSGLNYSATITVYDVENIGYPDIYKDGSICSDCNIISWDSSIGRLVFSVSSFSNYTWAESNQSKIENIGTDNESIYFYVIVEKYNTGSWEYQSTVVNETSPAEINVSEHIKLDAYFNGKWSAIENGSGGGIYRVYAAVTDSDGNIYNDINGDSLVSSYNFTVVESIIDVTLNSPADDAKIVSQNITFNWTATSNLGNLTCDLYADDLLQSGGVAVVNNTPYTYVEDSLEIGNHNWSVKCFDITGNYTNSDTYNFFYDYVKPSVELISPIDSTSVGSSPINLIYKPIDNYGFVNCSLYTNLTGSWEVNQSNSSAILNDSNNNFTLNLGSGASVLWNVYCYDLADNVNFSSSNYTFVYDVRDWDLDLIYPVNNSYYNNISYFKWYVDGNYYNDDVKCNLSIDDVLNESLIVSGVGENTTQNINFVEEGNHNWSVSCLNADADETKEEYGYFGIDDTYPNINFTTGTAENGSTQGNTDIFVNVSANDSVSNISTFIDFDNSLVSWWRMDDLNGTGGVVDYMSRNNGTAVDDASQVDNGYFGKGFEFDGINDGIDLGVGFDTSGWNEITVSAWMKGVASVPTQNSFLVGFGESSDDRVFALAWKTGQDAEFSVYNTANSKFDGEFGDAIQDTNWHHVVGVLNGTNSLVYVDGVLGTLNQEAFSGTLQTFESGTDGLWIGGTNGVAEFNGSIDDVMIFNRPLSAEEIIALYANQSPTYLDNNFTDLAEGDYIFKAYVQDLAGNVNFTEERSVTVDLNEAPNLPTVTINSSSGENVTMDDLYCRATVTDDDGDDLNVSVEWYREGALDLTVNYTGVENGTAFAEALDSGNTSKHDNWSCRINLYDGSEYSGWGNSSNLTIENSLPVVVLTTPEDWNATTNRTPLFNWTATDADSDSMTYEIDIKDHLFTGGAQCDDDRNDDTLTTPGYVPASVLQCLYDNGYYYNWTVRASDDEADGSWADVDHVNITASTDILLTNDEINFGDMAILEINDTSDDSPAPFLIENVGNVLSNISANSTSLWETESAASSYYQIKANNNTGEEGAFSWLKSIVDWLNMPITGNAIILSELNYEDDTDTAELDVRLEVPANEDPGAKYATIVFTSELAE